MNSLLQAYSFVSNQLREFLHKLPASDYAVNTSFLNGNSIGKHCRHIIETMEALCKSGTTICYDERERKLIYEIDKDACLERYEELLAHLNKADLQQSIQVKHAPFPDLMPAENYSSSMGRELLYNLEHIIHHLAIIKLAAIDLGRKDCIPENFGIAFSTLNYQKA